MLLVVGGRNLYGGRKPSLNLFITLFTFPQFSRSYPYLCPQVKGLGIGILREREMSV